MLLNVKGFLTVFSGWETLVLYTFLPSLSLIVSGLACRILQVGPRGSKFLGSVMIEVPHVASLRDGDREVIILRCDTAAKNKWSEHKQEEEIDEKTLRVRTFV